MMLSVKECFLYMEVVHLVGVLWIVMSRKFIWLLDSGSAVNFMLGLSVLKSSCMLFDVCVAGVIHYQNVIHISKVCSDVVFIEKLPKVCIFKALKKEFCYES